MTHDDGADAISTDSTGADLLWDTDGQPFSVRFNDVYFSLHGGIDETRHVFIDNNHLPHRLPALAEDARFVIGETGFGTGLNFLVAWQTWRELAPPGARLHFVSVEKYPLSREQLKQALRLWPQLQALAEPMIDLYPPLPAEGFHRLLLDSGRVILTLIFDDAAQGLEQLLPIANPGPELAASSAAWTPAGNMIVDAWFLDGFAPAKNPAMWSPLLFRTIARLSGPGTTFATFSAAGILKKQLPEAGFDIEKVRGFGRKRDMLRGTFKGDNADRLLNRAGEAALASRAKKFDLGWHLMANSHQPTSDRHIIVIGGGLAGCHSARALAEKGYQVTLLEKGTIASGASGNAQGVVYAKLSTSQEALTRFNLTALLYAYRFYRTQIGFETCGNASGVVYLPQSPKQADEYRRLAARFHKAPGFLRWIDQQDTESQCGLALTSGGLLVAQAGWLDPRRLCRALIDHPNIAVREFQQVEQLHYLRGAHQGQWQALDEQGNLLAQAPQLIIASAGDALRLQQTRHLPVKLIRGQTTEIAATADSRKLSRVICGKGYIAPAHEDAHCLGASFNLHSMSTQPDPADDAANLTNVAEFADALSGISAETGARVGFRCTSPDYLPVVGPAPIAEKFAVQFADLRRSANARIDKTGAYYPGLFINVAQGSRGLAYTPLCADLLASMISAEPLPLPRDMVMGLHPARFLVRDLKRNRI